MCRDMLLTHDWIQVRDGVVTLLEAWVQVVPADRVITPLADYLNSPKAAGAEGKVCCPALCVAAFVEPCAAVQLFACLQGPFPGRSCMRRELCCGGQQHW